MDTHGKDFNRYCKTRSIPHMMIIDHTGKVAHLSIGFGMDSISALMGTINSLLAQVPTETVAVDGPTPGEAPLRAADGDPSLAAGAPTVSER